MKSGKLKALAMTGPKRVPIYPDLPTIGESALPGFSSPTATRSSRPRERRTPSSTR